MGGLRVWSMFASVADVTGILNLLLNVSIATSLGVLDFSRRSQLDVFVESEQAVKDGS